MLTEKCLRVTFGLIAWLGVTESLDYLGVIQDIRLDLWNCNPLIPPDLLGEKGDWWASTYFGTSPSPVSVPVHSALHEIKHVRHSALELTHREYLRGLAVITGLSDLILSSHLFLLPDGHSEEQSDVQEIGKYQMHGKCKALVFQKQNLSVHKEKWLFFFFTMMCRWLPYSLHGRGAIPPLSRSNSVPSNEGYLMETFPYSHFPLYYVKNNELLIITCVRKKVESKCGCPWWELCEAVTGKCVSPVPSVKWVAKQMSQNSCCGRSVSWCSFSEQSPGPSKLAPLDPTILFLGIYLGKYRHSGNLIFRYICQSVICDNKRKENNMSFPKWEK